jgi:hypothetical protein
MDLKKLSKKQLDDLLREACEGSGRAGVPERLTQYLYNLKKGGARYAAAAAARVDYKTIQSQKSRSDLFVEVESMMHQWSSLDVQRNLHKRATAPDATAGHIALFLKHHDEWVEPRTIIETHNPEDTLDVDSMPRILQELVWDWVQNGSTCLTKATQQKIRAELKKRVKAK